MFVRLQHSQKNKILKVHVLPPFPKSKVKFGVFCSSEDPGQNSSGLPTMSAAHNSGNLLTLMHGAKPKIWFTMTTHQGSCMQGLVCCRCRSAG
jgi:hypothetical protein